MINDTRKLYQRVAEALAAAIAAGRYEIGSRLPAERDLAIEFEVSRPTIRETMIALEMRGMVDRRSVGSDAARTDPARHSGLRH